MWLAASSFEVPDGLLATGAAAQLNPKPHQGLSSKNPAPHPALDAANSTVAIGLRAGLVLNSVRQSERARYYGSALGRFTSPDEFKGGIVDPFTGQDIETNTALPYADITDPQTLNKYAYVRNNPLRYTDPTGHCVEALTCTVEFGTAGAEIGSIGGPIGTAAGALIGGAIGAFTGYEIYKGAQAVVSLATKDESSQQAQPAPTRGQALSDAKNDAGVPTSQQPSKQATVPLTDSSGKPVVIDGQKQNTREYTHTTGSGDTVVIQDHSQGHTFPDGGQVGPHFNVRPADNTRNGSVPGTKPHYPYKKPGDEQ